MKYVTAKISGYAEIDGERVLISIALDHAGRIQTDVALLDRLRWDDGPGIAFYPRAAHGPDAVPLWAAIEKALAETAERTAGDVAKLAAEYPKRTL